MFSQPPPTAQAAEKQHSVQAIYRCCDGRSIEHAHDKAQKDERRRDKKPPLASFADLKAGEHEKRAQREKDDAEHRQAEPQDWRADREQSCREQHSYTQQENNQAGHFHRPVRAFPVTDENPEAPRLVLGVICFLRHVIPPIRDSGCVSGYEGKPMSQLIATIASIPPVSVADALAMAPAASAAQHLRKTSHKSRQMRPPQKCER